MGTPVISTEKKPIHVKPSFYALMFEPIKQIALKYGYNCVLHGSLNRDLDLILIPWQIELGSLNDMLNEIADYIGGERDDWNESDRKAPHGRKWYSINILRSGYCELMEGEKYIPDQQYYVDISVTPSI